MPVRAKFDNGGHLYSGPACAAEKAGTNRASGMLVAATITSPGECHDARLVVEGLDAADLAKHSRISLS
jgi:hypothetical protein